MLVHPQFDPVAISIGPVSIHWYGLTYLVAFGLFLWLASLRVARPQYASLGWQRRDVEDMLFYGVLGVIIGAAWVMRCSTSRATTPCTRWKC